MTSIVQNIVPLLAYFRKEGGQLAVEADNARLRGEEAVLELEVERLRSQTHILRTSQVSFEASRKAVMEAFSSPEDLQKRTDLLAQCEPGILKPHISKQEIYPIG